MVASVYSKPAFSTFVDSWIIFTYYDKIITLKIILKSFSLNFIIYKSFPALILAIIL